jgi:4-hydroxy-2-oxoheptanedioate aldolase
VTALRARLLGGGQATDVFVPTPHPVVAELLAGLGPDVLCLDQEHALFAPEAVHAVVGAAALGGAPVLVRVFLNRAYHVAAALDAGAAGVLVPCIESAEAAAGAVAFARHPPVGTRGFGPARSSRYGGAIGEAVACAPEETLVAIQVETQRGLDALNEILVVDVVFVGPGDLALSLGLDGPQLRPLLEDVVVRTHAAGKAAGTYAADAETAGKWLAAGVELVLIGSDLSFLAAVVEAAWLQLRSAR